MVVKFTTKNGVRFHGPPYTLAEQADFYRGSIVSVFRPAPQQQPPQEQQQPQKAKRRHRRATVAKRARDVS